MIISVTNLKGGVGKSTISRNIAVYFAQKGESVCVVDTDIEQQTTLDWKSRRDEGVDLDVFALQSVENLVKQVKSYQKEYDIIVIDGVPQLEAVTTKMILLSDLVLIPITPSIDDLKSFERFVDRVNDAKELVERDIITFLLLNKFSGRNNEDLQMREAMTYFKEFDIEALDSTLADRVVHKRSSKYGLTALEWEEDPKGQKEVQKVCEEIEKRMVKLLSV